jgi:hypothetical protein
MMQLIGGEDWLVRGTAVVKRIVIRDSSAVDEWPGSAVEWLALVAGEVSPEPSLSMTPINTGAKNASGA